MRMSSLLRHAACAAALAVGPLVAQAGTLQWHVAFDIVGDDHVELNFTTDDQATHSAPVGSFQGYLIDYTTLTGTSGGTAVVGVAPGIFGFGGAVPPGTAKNDNLFKADHSQAAPVVNDPAHPPLSFGGVAFQENLPGGEIYQLFADGSGNLKGCWSIDDCVVVLQVSGFTVTAVPEPASVALMLAGAALVAATRRRATPA